MTNPDFPSHGAALQWGGRLLVIAAGLFLISIALEYVIGWIGTARPRNEDLTFILEHWSELQAIWSLQTLAYGLFMIASLLLFKASRGAIAVVWAAFLLLLGLAAVMMVVTLLVYRPLLELHLADPESARPMLEMIGSLYRVGRAGLLLFLPLLLVEMVRPPSLIRPVIGWSSIGIVVGLLAVGALTALPLKLLGAAWFLLPLVLGWAYARRSAGAV